MAQKARSYVAHYWSTSGLLLGGVAESTSSRFARREDAVERLHGALEINRSANRACDGKVLPGRGYPEIGPHCAGAESTALRCRCPKCGELVLEFCEEPQSAAAPESFQSVHNPEPIL